MIMKIKMYWDVIPTERLRDNKNGINQNEKLLCYLQKKM